MLGLVTRLESLRWNAMDFMESAHHLTLYVNQIQDKIKQKIAHNKRRLHPNHGADY